MSLAVQFINSIKTKVQGRRVEYGDVTDPYFLAISGDITERRVTVAAEETAVLFDGAQTDTAFATASFVWVRSDRDCVLELTYDTANTYGTVIQTQYVKGTDETGIMGPAVCLPDARAYANYTVDFAAGTLVYVDKIQVKNTDTADSAIVEFICGD